MEENISTPFLSTEERVAVNEGNSNPKNFCSSKPSLSTPLALHSEVPPFLHPNGCQNENINMPINQENAHHHLQHQNDRQVYQAFHQNLQENHNEMKKKKIKNNQYSSLNAEKNHSSNQTESLHQNRNVNHEQYHIQHVGSIENFLPECSQNNRYDDIHNVKNNLHQQKLDKARSAYQARDVAATRAIHASIYCEECSGVHTEAHQQTSSELLKATVFGGLDGVVTIFAIVSGCVGAGLSIDKVILVGVGNLLADAISMGFGEYVSATAEEDFVSSEKAREEWEVENCPDEEKQEMIGIYKDRYGFSATDAKLMVDITFKYRHFFIQHMMVEELGLLAGFDGPSPLKRGIVMFLAFCFFGLLPLLGFITWSSFFDNGKGMTSAYLMAAFLSVITLFVVGFFKGKIVNQNSLKSGFLMACNGTIAGVVAYGVGNILQQYVGSFF